MPDGLTQLQGEVLDYLITYFNDEHQLPPTMSIAKRFGIGNNAAYGHLIALRRKGYIENNSNGKWKFTAKTCVVRSDLRL